MKRIKLENSKKYFTVSDEDYSRVVIHNWRLHWRFGDPFSSARIWATINGEKVMLARFIKGVKGRKVFVDHWDRNPLNNDQANLRVCTPTESNRNRGKREGYTSNLKGVVAKRKGYEASIKVNNYQIYLGFFTNEIDAGKAYDRAARKYFGEFACLNFPDEKGEQ